MKKFEFADAHVLVTGAASGIGEQLAHRLAERGAHLVLVDRDADGLAAVGRAIRDRHPHGTVHLEVADLADTGAIPALAQRILDRSPTLDLLVNNAGVALRGRFAEVSADEFDWVMAVNFDAPVALCRALLPALRHAPGSHIVNVSSVFGLVGVVGQPAYCASKFALRGFSEVLRQELEPEGMGVTTVFPGGVRTRIAATARIAARSAETESSAGDVGSLLTYPAERAATEILDGVRRRRARVLISTSAVVPDVLSRLLPSGYPAALRLLMRGLRRGTADRVLTTPVAR